jgi:PAS domain S-box-containing protein
VATGRNGDTVMGSQEAHMEAKLLAAAQEWRTTFDAVSDGVSLLDRENRILRCNQAMAGMLGKPFSEIIGRPCWELVHGTSGPIEGCPFLRMSETHHRENMVLPLSGRCFNVAVDPLLDGDGDLVGAVHIMADITEQVQAEEALRRACDELEFRVKERTAELAAVNEQLKAEITERKRVEELIQASLREKEVLLREIHHRVKNSLQVISSLLDLTSLRALDQQAIGLLIDARARIHTMALIHLQLYQSERFDRIDMGSHARELVDYLSQAFATKSRWITPVVEPSDVYLPITQAIPCALVLNEVISNAFKHAFREEQEGIIEISIRREADDTITLRVKDDGIGLPEAIGIETTDSLGLKLIRNLVQEQLRGRLQVKRDRGTEIAVEFPVLKE